MIYTLTFSILLALAYTLPLILTPLTLGLWILFIALVTASLLTLLSSSWFGLMLFIIYIGGMLVIFSYFAAVAPNQKLNILMLTILFISTFIILFFVTNLAPHYSKHKQIVPSLEIPPSFIYLFAPSQTPLIITLASLLLLALIFVVKITNRNEGPLRPFIYSYVFPFT